MFSTQGADDVILPPDETYLNASPPFRTFYHPILQLERRTTVNLLIVVIKAGIGRGTTEL